jgi:type II secretory pathway pseudopilin PulG
MIYLFSLRRRFQRENALSNSATNSQVHDRGSRRRSRAYTLVELTIVALLSAALIAVAARWVGQLGQVALQQVGTGVQSNIIIAMDRLDDDITAATHCDPWNLDSPLVDISPSSLTLFTDNDGDGEVKLVRWSVDTNTGHLTRAETQVGPNCSQPELPNGVLLLTGVTTGTLNTPVFTPVYAGLPSEQSTDWGSCTNRVIDRCRMEGLSVMMTVSNSGSPVVTKNIFNFSI